MSSADDGRERACFFEDCLRRKRRDERKVGKRRMAAGILCGPSALSVRVYRKRAV